MKRWQVAALVILGVIVMTSKSIFAAIKPGVSFGPVIKPTTRRIIDAAEYAFGLHGITPTITSGVDGTHKAGSLHYSGDALDWRIWESNAAGVTSQIVGELAGYLGADYDVILESDHIHVEYDPS